MEKLLSNGVQHQTVPDNYVFPPDKRPEILVSTCTGVPVIHLAGENQLEVSNQILDAGKEFGFFQVVDHGISEEVISDMTEVTQEFFGMAMEDKASYYSEDPNKVPRLFTSRGDNSDEIRLWRDCLRLTCYRGNESMHLYPEKPCRFRNVAAKFIAEVDGLSTRILKMISIGLGFEEGYFCGNLSKGSISMNINHYPPCPDPTLTLGLPSHCDPNLITLLLQGDVSGLQVLHGGKWVEVDPIPNAFIVNFGHVLEIITKGLLKSVEHRAVTNAAAPRTSVATFIVPTENCLIAPAQSMPGEHRDHPLYKSVNYSEFFKIYLGHKGDRESTMEAITIND